MAFSLFGAWISQLAPYVREEYTTFNDVNKHAEKLSSNLTAIHAALKDTEEKQITSHPMKDWLQKLTDATHILEDEANRDNITILHPEMPFVRRSIGKKMKKVAKRIHEIAEERTQLNIHPGMVERCLEDVEWRQTTSIITEPQILGRDEDMEKIVEFLLTHACEREELSVYSIVGHGGYGKTALAQQ